MEQTMVTNTENVEMGEIKLSRTMKDYIEKAIESLPEEDAFNENKILFAITDIFMENYPGGKLEYQLERMGMETTSKIKKAIEIYMTRYAKTK